jgi:hypothetical protein
MLAQLGGAVPAHLEQGTTVPIHRELPLPPLRRRFTKKRKALVGVSRSDFVPPAHAWLNPFHGLGNASPAGSGFVKFTHPTGSVVWPLIHRFRPRRPLDYLLEPTDTDHLTMKKTKKNQLEVNTQLRIAKSPGIVFEAIVNPKEISHYFISSGSARLDKAGSVTWRFADFGGQLDIKPQEIKKDASVSFLWSASGPRLG